MQLQRPKGKDNQDSFYVTILMVAAFACRIPIGILKSLDTLCSTDNITTRILVEKKNNKGEMYQNEIL